MDRRQSLAAQALFAVALVCGSFASGNAQAQIDLLSGRRLVQPRGAAAAPAAPTPKVTAKASIEPGDRDGRATLAITARMAPGWHIYSITQAADGPLPTRIKLDPSTDYRLAGDFVADPPAEQHSYPEIWPNLVVEEHPGEVTWRAPIELAGGADPARLKIAGAVNAQACADACVPRQDYKFVAVADERLLRGEKIPRHSEPSTKSTGVSTRVAGGNGDAAEAAMLNPSALLAGAADPAGPATYTHGHLTLEGRVEPAIVEPGGKARLVLSAMPTAPWHVYALADRDPQKVSKPTLIEMTGAASLHFGRPTASRKPETSLTAPGELSSYYAGAVQFVVEVQVPADMLTGEYPFEGLIGFQTCKEGSCDMPGAARFSGRLHVGAASRSDAALLHFTPAKYGEVAKLADARPAVAAAEQGATAAAAATAPDAVLPDKFEVADATADSLPLILLSAVLGGMILNLMPCALPVIGLKVLSFVEQADQHRSRVLILNLWYSAGILTVFMAIATLAATLKFKWGQQFASSEFNITMAAVVFAMALSFLGFWEIPIPGFVGTGSAQRVATREGAIGAFAKGVLTTVLATPCSGPFLGTIFGFTLTQPAAIIYLIYGAIGLGMSTPYLVLGAFPQLVRSLPRPGAWMETFKQGMAFVLLFTVVFIFYFMNPKYHVPTFALLIGIWTACWWIGRTPLTATFRRRALSWLEGSAVAAVVGSAAFTWLVPGPPLLEWQPFSRPALAQLSAEGKTVMIDFTAEWCLNCKFNMRTAINTENVRELVRENGVVPMLADWTNADEEIGHMLESLQSGSIPVLAIFPADNPHQPIVLRDVITQGQLLEALKRAGPSRPGGMAGARPESDRSRG